MGLFRDIWGHLGIFGDILGHLGIFRGIWGYLGTFGDIWRHLGTFGDIWGHLGTFGDIWGHLGTSGYIGQIFADIRSMKVSDKKLTERRQKEKNKAHTKTAPVYAVKNVLQLAKKKSGPKNEFECAV